MIDRNRQLDLPKLEDLDPEFTHLVDQLSLEYKDKLLSNLDQIEWRVKSFFNNQKMDDFEEKFPGWKNLTKAENKITLYHTVCALIALQNLPEYLVASEKNKELLKWCVLLHDIAKDFENSQPDRLHAFKSAARTGKILSVHISSTNHSRVETNKWSKTLMNAYLSRNSQKIQDNSKLPAIIQDIETLFGQNSSVSKVIKTILFHKSIQVIQDWPHDAPLSDAEVKSYFNSKSLRFLEILMLADSDSWNLFDNPVRDQYRSEIRKKIDQLILILL